MNPVVVDGAALDVREFPAHDGEGYARGLDSPGLGAVVLRYRLRPDPFPLSLQLARAALAALRSGTRWRARTARAPGSWGPARAACSPVCRPPARC